ncbi:MAG: tRNA (adenosine(37)-N6)-threonylcarbamoyltransferase complex dimerization subunit type 1 TsaB [Muribaculaceae bacterium]|nr:tRNA (adenosine(37)-N6)-threonylcarbamoyltransferase complex dimerization subunit type 1 TsaB [Muribaculaceae bacterium]
MATILNIDTSLKVCSVALSSEGCILYHLEDFNGPNHAYLLSNFIKSSLDYLKEYDDMKLDAVSVSVGPGSYTGLRIGLSEAKGIAYGLKLPLIGINTLELLAVEAMFEIPDFDPENDLLIPVIDARRNEVYTSAYDSRLLNVMGQQALILDNESYGSLPKNKRFIFVGDGAKKVSEIVLSLNDDSIFLKDTLPLATGMTPLSEKYFYDKKFLDLAYSTPNYIKEFQATVPKSKI